MCILIIRSWTRANSACELLQRIRCYLQKNCLSKVSGFLAGPGFQFLPDIISVKYVESFVDSYRENNVLPFQSIQRVLYHISKTNTKMASRVFYHLSERYCKERGVHCSWCTPSPQEGLQAWWKEGFGRSVHCPQQNQQKTSRMDR